MAYEKKENPDLFQNLMKQKKELNEAKESISEVTKELNEYKNKETELNSKIQKLQAEIQKLQAEIEISKEKAKNLDLLNERIASLENEKSNLNKKLELKETKIEELLQDKENLLKEKSDILESKNELLEQVKKKELELQEKEQKLEDLKEKFKKSSSDLLSKTMEIDKLIKKDESLKIQDDLQKSQLRKKEELEKELTGGTRVISSMEDLFEIIKEVLPQAKSSIRLVIPDIQDINKYNLIDKIKEMPNKVRINLAAKIEDPLGDDLARELRNYCQLTNYFEKRIIALFVDSSIILIGIFKGMNVIGIYSELLEIIEILKPAIMEPFIKGIKI